MLFSTSPRGAAATAAAYDAVIDAASTPRVGLPWCSQTSIDVEDRMYERCKDLGITLFTVSHRNTLWKHHDWVLRFNGTVR